MRVDLKNTEQIFEGNEARFKLVSFILLKIDYFRIFARTLPIFLRLFPNFILLTEGYL